MICELNSPARALLAELRAAGAELRVVGGRLEAKRLPPALAPLARTHAAELRALLAHQAPAESPTPGRIIEGPWGPPEVLSLGCSPGAAAFALSAIAAHVPNLDSAIRHAHQREGLSHDDMVIVLGVGTGGPLPDGATFVMHRRWYLAHWTRQKAPMRPCARGRVVVVVVDGRGGRGVACSYAPPRLIHTPPRRS